MVLFFILVLSGCSQSSVQHPAATATLVAYKTATPDRLPAFSDWRTAYVDASTRLHIVSLDGKTDLSDQLLDGLTTNGDNISSAGFSRDGHLLAYVGAQGLVVMDVTERVDTHQVTNAGSNEVAWSPDGSQIALGDGQDGICVARISGGPCHVSPHVAGAYLASIVGWTDDSHIAMQFLPPLPSGTSQPIPRIGIGVLDVISWSFRAVATFSGADLGTPQFLLSPDGKRAFYFNKRFRDDPYTPAVREIDLTTGAITSLPHLAQMMGPYSSFFSVAWRPGTQIVAASSDGGVNGDPKTWMLDLQHDTATQMSLPGPRNVGGWTPDGSHLVLTTGWQYTVNGGPYELDAATVQADGQTTLTILTKGAMTFPYMGFVRTA